MGEELGSKQNGNILREEEETISLRLYTRSTQVVAIT